MGTMTPTGPARATRVRAPALRLAMHLALCSTAVLLQAAAWAAEPVAAAAGAVPASAPFTHRPLRPTEPQHFAGFASAPAFSVGPRKEHLTLYPCSQCHKVLPLNTEPRKLVSAPHPAALQHGQGRMWCLACHLGKDRDKLQAIDGSAIDFDQSYLLCGQCHANRQRDWFFGSHGKRVAGWTGERELYACTHCHDPHSPRVPPRAPSPAPAVRVGLSPMERVPAHAPPPWQRSSEHKP